MATLRGVRGLRIHLSNVVACCASDVELRRAGRCLSMAGNGAPPKHKSVRARRNAPTTTGVRLPSEGRVGKRTPPWPLPTDGSLRRSIDSAEAMIVHLEQELADADEDKAGKLERELRQARIRLTVAENDRKVAEKQERKLWLTLWKLPQAVAWEQLAYLNEVAQYVRWKTRAELGELDASKEARMLGDRLGLTPASMLHLRWEIVMDEVGAARDDKQPTTAPNASVDVASADPAFDPRSGLRVV